MAQSLLDQFVDTQWIASHLNDPNVRLVEVDVSRAAYDKGHIPGAVFWNAYTDLRHPDYRPMNTVEFEGLLSRSGLTPDMTVIMYGYAHSLGFWLMKAYGHKQVRLIEGVREGWRNAGHALSMEAPTLPPTVYRLQADEYVAHPSRVEVQGMIDKPDALILDVRSQAEYNGGRFWPSGATAGAGRSGHIPGAVNVPIELLRTEDGAFRSVDEMRQVLREHGVMAEHEVVSYCTIGNRASQAWFGLKYLLGYPNVQVYYGSWAEWGTQAETPIET